MLLIRRTSLSPYRALKATIVGTVTFTDTLGHQDVVPIESNGVYSADLSNLANGTITYLLEARDPAGNVVAVDPPLNLGDGSANAPTGTPQNAKFVERLCHQADWNVAAVDYHVGVHPSVTLNDPLVNGSLAPALVALGGFI